MRTPAEYNDGHIENAIDIDYRSDAFRNEVGQLDRNKTILI
ncbi:rhodanese-like domain-containing protein [bacterium]|nr:rhodanese-like domain-containing protein [bacterium]